MLFDSYLIILVLFEFKSDPIICCYLKILPYEIKITTNYEISYFGSIGNPPNANLPDCVALSS